MKIAIRTLAFLMISFLEVAVSPSSSFASDYEGNCRTVVMGIPPDPTPFTHVGGRYITSQGVLTSFVLFVRFADDNEVTNSWQNPAVLPNWAQNILNPNYSATGNYTLNSLTHYIYENSYGKLHIIGDVYYVQLPHNELYYYGLSGEDAAWTAIQQDALDAFESQFHDLYEGRNMSKYDNWTRTSEFNHVYTGPGSGQPKDNIVDMCWVILRNLHDENYTTYGLGEDIALLYASKTIDGVSIESGYPAYGSGSGISLFSHNWRGHQMGYNTVIKMPLSEYDNDGQHCTIIGTMVHELSHWFFWGYHFGTPNLCRAVSSAYSRSSSHMFPYTVNSGAAYGNFLGYEKIHLGWITSSEIQEISLNTYPVNLPDMETTTSGTKIVKIPLDANQSIFVENRSWNSIYEARYVPNNFQKPLKPGVLAYLITREDDYLNNTPIQQICADGKWTWNIIAGGSTGSVADNDDVIIKATPNSTTGYDEREDIHIAGQGTKTWWALYYPNAYLYGSNFGRWHKGDNYINDNLDVGDYRGDVNKLFDVGYVISPWSNGATHKWSEASGQFVPTTIGIEVTGYNSSNSSYTLSVRTSNPDQLSPSKPQNLAVSSQRVTKYQYVARLDWAANTEPDMQQSGAVYELYRKAGGSGYGLFATVPYTQTTYTDYDVTVGSGGLTIYYCIKAKDTQGLRSTYSDEVSIGSSNWQEGNVRQPDIVIAPQVPEQFELTQNYPNPFNPTTNITYALPEAGVVHLTVFDYLGRDVTTLVNEYKEAGYYEASFDASRLSSGMYFYKIQAGKFSAVKKMLLVR